MTIVAAVKSMDCLVLGTDSMTQVVGSVVAQQQSSILLKSYSNATKLFHLMGNGFEAPMAAATWGIGNIGSNSIGGLMSAYQAPSGATLEEVARKLAEYVQTPYSSEFASLAPEKRPVLGFLLGGYDETDQLPELWDIRFPGPNVTLLRGRQDFGANWRGIELPFSRLHFGADPRIAQILTEAQVAQEVIQKVMRSFETRVVFPPMPIQDAVAFAEYILRTTISFSTFEVGNPTCGEPIQLAVITRRGGFSWVHEPRFHV